MSRLGCLLAVYYLFGLLLVFLMYYFQRTMNIQTAEVKKWLKVLFLVLLVPLGAMAEEDASWPMFLYNPQHSAQSTSSLISPLELLWEFDAGDLIYASPAVASGKIFIGSLSGVFYAVDQQTGEPVWSFETADEITSSAAVVDGKVYFGGKDGILYCLNAADGKLVWEYKTQGKIVNSPALQDGVVYFGSNDMSIYAINAEDGGFIWTTPLVKKPTSSHGIYASPAVGHGLVYVSRKGAKIYALDAENGEIVWEFKTRSANYASPVLSGNTLYIGGYDRKLYALDAKTGKEQWEATVDEWIYASPIPFQNSVLVAAKDGVLSSFDSATGKLRWSRDLRAPISSTLAITQSGIAFVANEYGELTAINLKNGQPIWQETLSDDGFHSSPAIVGDRLYIGTMNGYLMAWGQR